MRVLTVIPARAGSKRLPGKNWMTVGDKDLIGHAVNQANLCRLWPSIVTDAPERCRHYIPASVATEPEHLAGDDVPMGKVVQWAAQQAGIRPTDIVLLLQPTSPLRTPGDITACVARLTRGDSDCVVSVSRRKRDAATNSHFETNGAIYAMRAHVALAGECVSGFTEFYVMPPERSIDINTAEDLAEARRLAGYG